MEELVSKFTFHEKTISLKKGAILGSILAHILVVFGTFFRKFFAPHFSRRISRMAVFRFREKCEKMCSTTFYR